MGGLQNQMHGGGGRGGGIAVVNFQACLLSRSFVKGAL